VNPALTFKPLAVPAYYGVSAVARRFRRSTRAPPAPPCSLVSALAALSAHRHIRRIRKYLSQTNTKCLAQSNDRGQMRIHRSARTRLSLLVSLVSIGGNPGAVSKPLLADVLLDAGSMEVHTELSRVIEPCFFSESVKCHQSSLMAKVSSLPHTGMGILVWGTRYGERRVIWTLFCEQYAFKLAICS
jgi:hypothetical protein